jgi:hypothetical protein
MVLAAGAAGALAATIAGSGHASSAAAPATTTVHRRAASTTRHRSVVASLVPRALAAGAPTAGWQPVVTVGGQPAAWIAQQAGVTLLRFDQRLSELHLHAGSVYPGGPGWLYGDQIEPSEAHRLIAGFNGGFKFNVAGNGFMEGGRTAVPLKTGLGSIVTYSSGVTAIGAWGSDVPAPGLSIASVRQNLPLLVDQGRLAGTATSCPLSCWGATIGGRVVTARSALGITAGGDLVWAAGEQLTPASVGRALIGASVVRAVQLDINPFWVAGYLYAHHPSGPAAMPIVPGQSGIAGQLRLPYSRDFFTIVSR